MVSGEGNVDSLVVTTRAAFGRATLGMWCRGVTWQYCCVMGLWQYDSAVFGASTAILTDRAGLSSWLYCNDEQLLSSSSVNRCPCTRPHSHQLREAQQRT